MRHRNRPGKYEIGDFNVESGKLVVSDPCYTPGTWCAGVLSNVKNGLWHAAIRLNDEGSWGDRVAELYVSLDKTNNDAWHLAPFTVGVDAGQVCIVDDKHFAGGEGEYHDRDSFYGDACHMSMEGSADELGAGILKSGHGVNSSSGYGDGSYECFYGTNDKGEITSVRVVFIPEPIECDNCGSEVDNNGWSEDDMVDGWCPECRGRFQCDDCAGWFEDYEMADNNLCKNCAPDEDEEK